MEREVIQALFFWHGSVYGVLSLIVLRGILSSFDMGSSA